MLHDLANDDGYGALKRAAEDKEGCRLRERMPKPAVQQKTADDDEQRVPNSMSKSQQRCRPV